LSRHALQINPLNLSNNEARGANISAMKLVIEMDKEKMLTLVKRVAVILLMACFFLALSRCTSKSDPGGRVVGADTYLYGYGMAEGALRDLNVDPLKSVATLTALFKVFFLPAAERPDTSSSLFAELFHGVSVLGYSRMSEI
jgi:hypothetical protein